jgi:hypothetical protein
MANKTAWSSGNGFITPGKCFILGFSTVLVQIQSETQPGGPKVEWVFGGPVLVLAGGSTVRYSQVWGR